VVYVKHLQFGKQKSLVGFHDKNNLAAPAQVIIMYVIVL